VDSSSGERGSAGSAGVPRWVKLTGLITVAVAVVVVVLLLLGGHGPGRHGTAGGDRGAPGPVLDQPVDGRR
jgi:hypothetical protein